MASLLSSLFRRSKPTVKTAPTNGEFEGDFERQVFAIGAEFLAQARAHKSGLLSRRFWSDKLMDWSMKDEAFKVQLFRFVDAFPNFKTPDEIYEHLVDFMSQPGVKPPPGMALGLKAGGAMKGTVAKTMAGQITGMAEKFIAGTDAKSAVPKLRRMWDDGLCFSVDLLGEACVSEREADEYQAKYLDLVENLPKWVNDWPAKERLETDHLGKVPRTNVSIKISSLAARTDPIAFERTIEASMERIVPILKSAKERGVLINFDMEAFVTKDLTIELFKRCCRAVDFEAGIAMQAYLCSGDDDAKNVIDWAKSEGRIVTVRLVKGAYWDYETIHADQMGWPVPVWSRKSDTDACFERMSRAFLGSTPKSSQEGGVKLALGSHNIRSIAVALAEMEKIGLPKEAIELQMLYGMADPLKEAATERGLRVREYVPVGEMVPGMAYLVRRLLENTSNESWLKAGFLDNASPEALLAAPTTRHDRQGVRGAQPVSGQTGSEPQTSASPITLSDGRASLRHQLSMAVPGLGDSLPFFTEPMRNFAHKDLRDAYASAVKQASIPKVANDSDVQQTNKAIAMAANAFPKWRDADPMDRSKCLIRAADKMRARRDELSGIVLKENGKDWRNADADVCEAIDFCDYYAREAIRLFKPRRLGQFVGELNETWHTPRGVVAVISPWNFPLAISAGMVTAALVTGNSVILKPAEQTPGIAKILCEILWEAGIPKDVLHFLPGDGEVVGAHLTHHDQVDMVAFTGSAAVGRMIIQAAATHPPKGRLAKHVVCETGGKNAIIVDASADLDEAVVGVRDSAFGFAGQKCSACSRVIVVESIHDAFLERLVEATRSLVVGDPIDPSTDVGPVIDQEAADRIRGYIELGKTEAKLEVGLEVPQGLEAKVGKPFVGPHVFSNVGAEDRIATEEIFGPVLAVIKVKDFDEALRVANSPAYKLTGGVYTRKPSHIEKARREFRVGNLYLNRGCTGALVGRQPFGGFGMSGLGSKAGGHDYLLQFVEPRAVAENTMRRGFAPGLNEQAQATGGDTAELRAGV